MSVMRAVEYMAVTDKIDEISGHFRSIGWLRQVGNNSFDNVYIGAELVSQSPFVDFEDRRRGAEGVLRDMPNADISGMMNIGIRGPYLLGSIFPDLPVTEVVHTRHTDAFFYGEVISRERNDDIFIFARPFIEFVIHVNYIKTGYPEHITVGQRLVFHYILTDDEFEAELEAINHYIDYGEIIPTTTSVDMMSVGNHYFLRGAFGESQHMRTHLGLPQEGRDDYPLIMIPLNIDTTGLSRSLHGDTLWYINVNPGEFVDSSVPGLDWLDDEIARLRHNQSAVWIRTTSDMTAIPAMQPGHNMIRLAQGRWLNREDYVEANPVAVIQEDFALWRGIEIGDTIYINVPNEQYGLNVQGLTFGTGTPFDRVRVDDILFVGKHDAPYHELALEVVGLYQIDSLFTRADMIVHTYETNMLTLVYMPDSVLPENLIFHDIHVLPQSQRSLREFFGFHLEHIEITDFLLHSWYSFVLNDPMDEPLFLSENRDALAALGFDVIFIQHGAQIFWDSAQPILQASAINAIVFSIVLILVMALVVFLFLRQRRKEYAILRALGDPAGRASGQLLVSMALIGIPAIIIGGVAGWFFALNRVASVQNPFGQLVTHFGFSINITIPVFWLLIIIAAMLIVMLIMTIIGISQISKRPVLELLQGTVTRK